MGRVPLVGRAKNRGLDVEAEESHARMRIRGTPDNREGAEPDEKPRWKTVDKTIFHGFTGDTFPARTD
jgi:hypothetical protein